MINIIGHRGGRALWPENSIMGFRKAVTAGVDYIELDVHLSADGQVIVMHDPTLERTTLGTGTVVEKTAAELTGIKLRDADGECISTLDNVFSTLAPEGAKFLVEIKTDPLAARYPGIEQKVIDLIERHGLRARTRIISFVPEILETVREIWPEAGVATPIHRGPAQMLGGVFKAIDRFDSVPGCIINIEQSLLKFCYEDAVRRVGAHRLGAGAVHSEADLRFWLSKDVAQVATDYPDRAVAIRRELGR